MIGIIDSGVGGLSVVSEFIRQNKQIPFVYLGDNKNNPYGTKNKEELLGLAFKLIDYLVGNHKIDTLIIACNTLVSVALAEITTRYPQLHIEDILTHGAIAATMSFSNNVSVIATKMTVATNAYKKKITSFCPDVVVSQYEAQSWVQLVEEDRVDLAELELVVDKLDSKTDMVILGCTHFPFLYCDLRKLIDQSIQIIDPAISCVQQLEYGIDLEWQGKSLFLTTGCEHSFNQFISAKKIGNMITPIRKIVLE
ncbi:MAG: glutamate racemase [Culicoidibacterales bacterium]